MTSPNELEGAVERFTLDLIEIEDLITRLEQAEAKGSITASCGHRVNSADDLVSVEYEDEHCDAVEGFIPVTVYAEYCRSCAALLRAIKEGADG